MKQFDILKRLKNMSLWKKIVIFCTLIIVILLILTAELWDDLFIGDVPLATHTVTIHQSPIFHQLIQGGDVNYVKSALKADPSLIKVKDDFDGGTALHEAAMLGNKEIVDLLISNGAEIDAKDESGRTPLFLACDMRGNKDIVEVLISNGSDVNTKDRNGNTPLNVAARSCQKDIAEYIVEHGAQINVSDKKGKTPLHEASEVGCEEIVRFLVDIGAEIEAKDKYGATALSWAVAEGHKNVVEFLISRGADVNTKDIVGRTPLFDASARAFVEIVKLLVGNGADINVKDKSGRTLLHEAVDPKYLFNLFIVEIAQQPIYQKMRLEVMKFLISKGADVNVKDDEGHTPLALAIANSEKEVEELLRKHGGK